MTHGVGIDRPVLSAQIGKGQWPSFLIRYAVWREELELNREADSDSDAKEQHVPDSELYNADP
ncbi:MAG: hypothetical protein KDA89_21895 [Planctomycetaceae bacterium]|nr:hypothetical protein [Planctomycetaceae bacterium]